MFREFCVLWFPWKVGFDFWFFIPVSYSAPKILKSLWLRAINSVDCGNQITQSDGAFLFFLQDFIDTITVQGTACNGQIQSRKNATFKTASAANTAIIYVIALHSGSGELCFVSQRTDLIQLLTSYQVMSIKAVMRFIKQMVCISTCTGGVVLGMTQVRVDDVSSDSHLSSESLLRQRYLRNNYYRMHCAYWK